MPRNPDKSPCHVPGCRNWAMRTHTHCRSHRDRELGPRGGGAPAGNLNALRTGDHAHPLSPATLSQLAAQLVGEPDSLPVILDGVVRSVHRRAPDPYSGLAALRVAITGLRGWVAAHLLTTEAEAWLLQLPPSHRASALQALQRRRHLHPDAALRSLRALIIESEKSLEQVPVHARTLPRGSSTPPAGPRRASPSGK
jgi:hypothetical protein